MTPAEFNHFVHLSKFLLINIHNIFLQTYCQSWLDERIAVISRHGSTAAKANIKINITYLWWYLPMISSWIEYYKKLDIYPLELPTLFYDLVLQIKYN